MMVSHHDHHRHTAYLLAHVDASGFSQNQLKRLGDLALGQRGGLRKLEPQLGDETLLWQVLALRLAVIHAHARGAIAEGSMRLQRQGRRVRVQLDRDWAAAQPRAFYLMQEELQAWSKLDLIELTLQA